MQFMVHAACAEVVKCVKSISLWQDGPSSAGRKAGDTAAAGSGKAQSASKAPSAAPPKAPPKATPARAAPAKRKKGRDEARVKVSDWSSGPCVPSAHALHSTLVLGCGKCAL